MTAFGKILVVHGREDVNLSRGACRNIFGTSAGLFAGLFVAIGPARSVVSVFVLFTSIFGLASKALYL